MGGEFLEGIIEWMTLNSGTIILALAAVVTIQLILVVVLFAKSGKLKKRLHIALAGVDGKNLEALLALQHQQVAESLRSAQELRQRTEHLEQQLRLALQRVGIVRFNAFPEMGSELSFSIALLNDRIDGVVITGITGRDEFRVYAKQIEAGKSQQHLSAEETRALQQAGR
jgi:hypothetical protein